MIKYIEDTEKYAEITGFRKVSVDNKEKFLNAVRGCQKDLTIQLFNADLVCTWEHLYFAALNAQIAFRTGTNISKRPDMEMLLYASTQRQISKAIPLIGIKNASTDIALVVIGPSSQSVKDNVLSVSSSIKCQPDDSVLELNKEKVLNIKKAFRITELEIRSVIRNTDVNQALVDLVIERMALLPTQI